MALEGGTVLHDRYRIEAVLAQGGMGSIYRALDLSLGVQVAVKENLVASEEASRQFHREATLLAGLRHANLPRVTDHFEITNQGQYLVMDYIEGEDLRQRMSREEHLTEEEAILIGVAVCEALTYLHSRQPAVIHRDIKPGNLKITPTGQVFLVDFGLAKTVQAGQVTTLGAQALTPGYAPPEQYGQGTSPRSDIYSLGATLYATLTGRIPEDGLARAMGTSELTPLRRYNPAISVRVASVIEKSMSVNLAERYASAEDFKQILLEANTAARRQTAQPGGIRVRPAPPPPTQPGPSQMPTVQRHSPAPTPEFAVQPVPLPPARTSSQKLTILAVILAGLAFLGIIGGGLAYYFLQRDPGTPAPTLTVLAPLALAQPTVTQTPPMSTPTVAATLQPTTVPTLPSPSPAPQDTPAAAALPPDGGSTGQFAFVSNRGGLPQVWLENFDGSQAKQITTLPDGACQPDWSPDGQRLVIVSPCRSRQDIYHSASLFILQADGSGLIPLVSVPGGDFQPAWSPDGSQIAFVSIRQNNVPYIFVYDLATNKAKRLTNTSTNELHPAWSPDGKMLAFVSWRLGLPQVWTIEMSGKNVRELSPKDSGIANFPAWAPNGEVVTYALGNDSPQLVSRVYPPANSDAFLVADMRPARSPTYSKDGQWLVFESLQSGNLDIYRMNALTGANLTRLTDDPAEDYHPAWRP